MINVPQFQGWSCKVGSSDNTILCKYALKGTLTLSSIWSDFSLKIKWRRIIYGVFPSTRSYIILFLVSGILQLSTVSKAWRLRINMMIIFINHIFIIPVKRFFDYRSRKTLIYLMQFLIFCSNKNRCFTFMKAL